MIAKWINAQTVKIVVSGSSFFFCSNVFSHHSVALQFDMTKEITVSGSVVELEWRNPHAWLHLEVESEVGEPELWKVEFG